MSHAIGKVVVDGEVKAWYEYNGTVDVAISHLYDTEQEVWDNWRDHEWLYCTCGQPPKPCLLYTDYGFGFHWPGAVCMNCRAIVEGHNPYECDPILRINGDPSKEIDNDTAGKM